MTSAHASNRCMQSTYYILSVCTIFIFRYIYLRVYFNLNILLHDCTLNEPHDLICIERNSNNHDATTTRIVSDMHIYHTKQLSMYAMQH